MFISLLFLWMLQYFSTKTLINAAMNPAESLQSNTNNYLKFVVEDLLNNDIIDQIIGRVPFAEEIQYRFPQQFSKPGIDAVLLKFSKKCEEFFNTMNKEREESNFEKKSKKILLNNKKNLNNNDSGAVRDARGDNFMRLGRSKTNDFMRLGRTSDTDSAKFDKSSARDFLRFGRYSPAA